MECLFLTSVTARSAEILFIMPDELPQFNAFDPEADVDISARFMPHWFQPGVATFITMRTLDSFSIIGIWTLAMKPTL